MFGIPDKELKAAAEHVDRTLTSIDATLVDARTVLRHVAGIAEDLHAITSVIRALVVPKSDK